MGKGTSFAARCSGAVGISEAVKAAASVVGVPQEKRARQCGSPGYPAQTCQVGPLGPVLAYRWRTLPRPSTARKARVPSVLMLCHQPWARAACTPRAARSQGDCVPVKARKGRGTFTRAGGSCAERDVCGRQGWGVGKAPASHGTGRRRRKADGPRPSVHALAGRAPASTRAGSAMTFMPSRIRYRSVVAGGGILPGRHRSRRGRSPATGWTRSTVRRTRSARA